LAEVVWIKRKEICLALALSVLVVIFAVYSNIEILKRLSS
jgi:hypothetical protein